MSHTRTSILTASRVPGVQLVTPSVSAKIGHAAAAVMGGIAGMAKATIGLDQVDVAIQQARLVICESCEHSSPSDKPVERRRCGKLLDAIMPGSAPCGCGLASKTSLGGQACPLGKWEAIDGPSKVV